MRIAMFCGFATAAGSGGSYAKSLQKTRVTLPKGFLSGKLGLLLRLISYHE